MTTDFFEGNEINRGSVNFLSGGTDEQQERI